jgi:hypothetical protein
MVNTRGYQNESKKELPVEQRLIYLTFCGFLCLSCALNNLPFGRSFLCDACMLRTVFIMAHHLWTG